MLYTAPVLHPLIHRLRDSRCSGQSKQRGSWREGSFDLLQSAIMWLPAGLKNKEAPLLVCKTCLALPVEARAQGHTFRVGFANVVLSSRCQPARKLTDTLCFCVPVGEEADCHTDPV